MRSKELKLFDEVNNILKRNRECEEKLLKYLSITKADNAACSVDDFHLLRLEMFEKINLPLLSVF